MIYEPFTKLEKKYIEGSVFNCEYELHYDCEQCNKLTEKDCELFVQELNNGIKPKKGWDEMCYLLCDNWCHKSGGTVILSSCHDYKNAKEFYLECIDKDKSNKYHAIYQLGKLWIVISWWGHLNI